MKIKYDYLYAVEYSKPDLMDESGYKYVIPGLYTAYRTDNGFEHFKEIYNLKELKKLYLGYNNDKQINPPRHNQNSKKTCFF